jgi:hypothetical protein
LLAKNQRAPLGIWFYASSFTTIASKLAPTERSFPKAHHFVTECPSVAQNPAQVTTHTSSTKSLRKISSPPEPLFQALSSHFKTFLEYLSNKLAA